MNITSANFVLGLGLMLDALEERNIDMCRASIRIQNLINISEKQKEVPGTAYKQAVQNMTLCGDFMRQLKQKNHQYSKRILPQTSAICREMASFKKGCRSVKIYIFILDEKKLSVEAKYIILFGKECLPLITNIQIKL